VLVAVAFQKVHGRGNPAPGRKKVCCSRGMSHRGRLRRALQLQTIAAERGILVLAMWAGRWAGVDIGMQPAVAFGRASDEHPL
jgi:hypothetical protein